MTYDDIPDDAQVETNAVLEEARQAGCIDRGEGLQPMHIYLDDSGQCQCGKGPRLKERRME